MSVNQTLLKVASHLNVDIGPAKLSQILKLSIPITYTLGDEEHTTVFEVIVDDRHKDNEKLCELIKLNGVDDPSKGIILSLSKLFDLEQTIEQIENFIHEQIKHHYKGGYTKD